MKVLEKTVPGLFFDAAEERPDERFIVSADGWSISYGAAAGWIAATAQALCELGVERGERVVCYVEDTVPLVVIDLACASIGAHPVPVSPLFSLVFLAELTERLGARHVYTLPSLAPAVGSLSIIPLCHDDLPPEHSRLGPAAVARRLPGAEEAWPHRDAIAWLRPRVARLAPGETFLLQPTSGSTGRPKFVIRPHIAFTRYAHYVGRELGRWDERPRFLAVAALTHAFGLHMFTTALHLGAELCVPRSIDTAALLSVVRELDPSVLPTTPRVLRSLHRQSLALPERQRTPLFGPSARFLLSAGGKADPELLEMLRGQGIEPIPFYGSSEASIMVLTPRGDWRPGWAGRVVPDVDMVVGPQGELLVRSPGQMIGYHGDEPLTREAYTEDGYYKTGDLGEIAPDGFVRIFGRKRDVFNTPEGTIIHPGRIEALIERLDAVEQAFLVGDGKPFLTAFVVPADLGQLGAAEERGVISPAEHPEKYGAIRGLLADLNRRLERIERIAATVLLCRPFDTRAYARAGAGKVRRDRAAFGEIYRRAIDTIYISALEFRESPHFVPGADRRLRSREGSRSIQPRYPVSLPASLRLGAETHRTRLTDIGIGGAALEAAGIAATKGQTGALELDGHDVSVSIEVAHVSQHRIGLRFTTSTREFVTAILALIEREGV